MNKRIRKKVLKRAEAKVYAQLGPAVCRSTTEIAKIPGVLTPLERKVFIADRTFWNNLTLTIVNELKEEENVQSTERT
ncbi:MAG: hypothetical protein IJZ68_09265 [Bacteroidaceae bacterium]|nr:hypothetical protein [Bacteroidaceae bacterium]